MSSTRDHELVWGMGDTLVEWGPKGSYPDKALFDGEELEVWFGPRAIIAIDADTLAKLLTAAGWKVER